MAMNLLAVLVASIASFLLGFLWYGPLFGKQWMKLMKFNKKDMKSMKMSPKTSMTIGFLSTCLIAYILSMFVDLMGSDTILGGAVTGFWIWLGFIATTTLGSVLWENKSLNLYVLNNFYNLINFALMGIILAIWP